MKSINKIVLLSDEKTSLTGRSFFASMQKQLEERHLKVWNLALSLESDIANAVYQFDRIALEIQPDLLIVADFACIKMQSPEEEPFYNNMTIPVIHLLFRRPWEYDVFMVWRSNFIDRYYLLVSEDVKHIREYYKRVPNITHFEDGLWNQEEKLVCYSGQYTMQQAESIYQNLPGYMKTIAERWCAIMEREPYMADTDGLKQCLREIGFDCSDSEYLDILYMMQGAFSLYYYKKNREMAVEEIQIQTDILQKQIDEFLNLDFKVSLL